MDAVLTLTFGVLAVIGVCIGFWAIDDWMKPGLPRRAWRTSCGVVIAVGVIAVFVGLWELVAG